MSASTPDPISTVVERVQVTTPTGRHLITADPLHVAAIRYPTCDGYRLREVTGYDAPDRTGFCIVHTADRTGADR